MSDRIEDIKQEFCFAAGKCQPCASDCKTCELEAVMNKHLSTEAQAALSHHPRQESKMKYSTVKPSAGESVDYISCGTKSGRGDERRGESTSSKALRIALADKDDLRAQLKEAQTLAAAKQDEGMVLVPKEPTEAMFRAVMGEESHDENTEATVKRILSGNWEAMLSAAAESGGG